jgi:hypothetical protein
MRKKLIVLVLIVVVILPIMSLFLLADMDGDGLYGYDEISRGLNPLSSDSDGDGLSDNDEISKFYSNPCQADTDGDGLNDGEEVACGSYPKNPDSDKDGWNDYYEVVTMQTSPMLEDTDDDWIADPIDQNPTDFNTPTGYSLVSAEFNSEEYNRRKEHYANYTTVIEITFTVTRKPLTEEDRWLLMNGSLVLDGQEMTSGVSRWAYPAKENGANPTFKVSIHVGFLKNGNHSVSYNDFSYDFRTEAFTYADEIEIPQRWANEKNAILTDVFAAVKPNKYFGLALVFGAGYSKDSVGLRIYAFRGCSIESSEIQNTEQELKSTVRQILLNTVSRVYSKPLTWAEADDEFQAEMLSGGYWYSEQNPDYRMYFEGVEFAFVGAAETSGSQTTVNFADLRIPEEYVSITSNVLKLAQGNKAYLPLFTYVSFPEKTKTVLREITPSNSLPLNTAIPVFRQWESTYSKYPTQKVYFKLNALSLGRTSMKLLSGDVSQIPSVILYGVSFYDLTLLLGKIYAIKN